MNRQLRWLIPLLAALLLIGETARADDPTRDYTTQIDSATIEAHVIALAGDIGARPTGSKAEAQAADYIAGQLAAWGYTVERQDVPFDDGSGDSTQNVIATKAATTPADPTQVIVIGAHMDSSTMGTGADDNASGVAVILTVAEALAGLETQHDIVFVAFGSEEEEARGSNAFVDALTPDEIAAIMVMFNVDTVGAGDFAYVYAGAITENPLMPGPTWARDLALSVAADLGHDLRTSPSDYWDGFTGAWSDHYAFVQQGIPIAYFERWNWDAGDNPRWGTETVRQGDILHTEYDQVDAVDPTLAEPVAEVLATTVARLAAGDVQP